MKKLFKKIGLMAIVAAGAVGSLVANTVHAAADSDFASSAPAFLANFTDNKGTVWLIIAGVLGISLVLGLGIRSLVYGKNQIINAVPGGKRKGR